MNLPESATVMSESLGGSRGKGGANTLGLTRGSSETTLTLCPAASERLRTHACMHMRLPLMHDAQA